MAAVITLRSVLSLLAPDAVAICRDHDAWSNVKGGSEAVLLGVSGGAEWDSVGSGWRNSLRKNADGCQLS